MERTWRGCVFVGVSLDGLIARPNSDLDWLTDPPLGRPHRDITSSRHGLEWPTFIPGVDHILMGRATYEKVLTFDEWPYGDKAVIVLGTTPVARSDRRVLSASSLTEATRMLADRDARNVYIDGGRTVQSCLAADLVDEITVAFAPVLIGDGIPLFGALHGDILLTLEGTHATAGGMVHVTYSVHRDRPVASLN